MVYLRELTGSDIPIINKWRQNQELVGMLGGPFRYVNLETDEKWFQAYMNNRNSQVRCCICDKESSSVLGVVYLLNIDQIIRSAEFAIMIGSKQDQNKGVGTKATQLMLSHGFNNLNLNRVYLEVLENNHAAVSVYEKCGFTQEGRLREAAYKNGSYCDLLVMSILRKEFIDGSGEKK